jgi:hypothetical protein
MDLEDYSCLGLPTRSSQKVDKGINEWSYAENAAFFHFGNDFLKRHRGGVIVNQLTWSILETHRDPGIQFILKAMKVYFRNWWSQSNTSRPGGFRKPDGMGISPGGKVIEIIEVKPNKNEYYNAGLAQLNEMTDKIKSGLDSWYKEESILRSHTPIINPLYSTTVKGSPWRPQGPELVVPIINSKHDEIAWICYKPTRRMRSDKGKLPEDGIILYEIHNLDRHKKVVPQFIPESLARRLAEAHARRVTSPFPSLTPWAWAKDYVLTNPKDADMIKKMVIGIGVAAAIIIVTLVVIRFAPRLTPVVVQGGIRVMRAAMTGSTALRVTPVMAEADAAIVDYEFAASANALAITSYKMAH